MCLIAWRWCPDARDSLVLLSNRDEFFDRPTAPAMQWPESNIWAGRDQRAGGSWLGVTDAGRLAAITNHRAPDLVSDQAMSRGNLVRQFLEADLSSEEFTARLSHEYGLYSPFNLMVYDGDKLLGFEGRVVSHRVVMLEPGYGGVSNADFNTPWHKQVQLHAGFTQIVEGEACSDDALLDLLLNDQVASMHQLPQTGIPIDKEVALSAPFVRMSDYGTRASTLIRIEDKKINFVERGFDSSGLTYQTHHLIHR